MDLNLDSIKQKFKQMYLLGRYPDRDWHRVLIASIALLACIGIWSFLFFFQIQSAGLSAINNLYAGVNHAMTTPSDQLNDLIKSYDAKTAEHQALIDRLK